jgi:S1/P1 nuclease
MKNTLKYILAAAIILSAAEAFAWNKQGHETIAVLAAERLTPAAKAEAERILGGSLKDNAMWLDDIRKEAKHTAGWHYVSLDADLKSAPKSENDAVVQVERAADVLRNRASHNDSTVVAALRTMIHLVGDMHSIAHVRISGIAASQRNFNFVISNGHTGKKKAESKCSWKKYWDGVVINRHGGFSPEMYAEDVAVCHGAEADALAAGTPRDWACDMGRECKPLYEWAKADYFMTREQDIRLEPILDRCLARASYRLAALLNECLK